MRRLRRNDRSGAGRGSGLLVRLATAASAAGSRIEDQWWDARLAEAIKPLLTNVGMHTIENSLERLSQTNPRAYDILADAVECAVESGILAHDGAEHDCLLFLAPALAWSRGRIPSGKLRDADLDALRIQLGAHVFAPGARIALSDRLYTPDQLPGSYAQEVTLARALFAAALGEGRHAPRADQIPEAIDFVSDARYVIGAVAVPKGTAMFVYQGEDVTIEASAQAWAEQGHGALAPMLVGCQFELMPPGAYYSTLRRVDQTARAFYLRSGVEFLGAMLNAEPAGLTASFGPFHEGQLIEYRIGLTVGRSEEIFHGVVWPVLSDTDLDEGPEQIRALLTGLGVTRIVEHEHRFPLEFSEEYGDPLFPSATGELVRAELPEDAEPAPMHLH
ncbi:DUF2863 family protein [Derxia gummosa]|uniref:DUF2863 family protein n=1 Tax=Derxia gummosa DSM 723 TaxID=1121388 RepID=A0A8B6X299_9BURK|nr:DUF2863 family protein [Derxia gummosa]